MFSYSLNGRKPNTVKSNIVDKFKSVSEVDQGVTFNASDFEDEIDSTILVRERTRGSMLEGKVKKKSRKVIKETTYHNLLTNEKEQGDG